LRRPFGVTIRRIALTNAFVDLPIFFDTQVLAIERQWALPTNSTTLFVPVERNRRSGGPAIPLGSRRFARFTPVGGSPASGRIPVAHRGTGPGTPSPPPASRREPVRRRSGRCLE